GSIDPIRDIEVITTELILADLQSAEQQLERNRKRAKGQDKVAQANVALLEKLIPHLDAGRPALTLDLADGEREVLASFCLLSSKRVLYACNVSENDIADPSGNSYVQKVRDYVAHHHGAGSCVICAQLEQELSELPPQEAREYLASLGASDSGVSSLIRETYS